MRRFIKIVGSIIFILVVLFVAQISLVYINLRPGSYDYVPDPSIERIVDTRDPKTISGSFWTKKLDCTFKNPPLERKMVPVFSCEAATNNIAILRKGGKYFVPRSTKDEPPYCLAGPSNSSNIAAARQSQRIYCRNVWPSWKNLLWELGAL